MPPLRSTRIAWCLILMCAAFASSLIAQRPDRRPRQPVPPAGTPGDGIRIQCIGGCVGANISPDGTVLSIGASTSGNEAEFQVTNTLNTFQLVAVSCTKTGAVSACTGGGSYGLDANETVGVSVTFSVGASGSGTVGLSGPTDVGYYNVNVVTPGAPLVALVNHNSTNRDQGLCLTTGAGEAAGVSCGNLFVVHGMPAYRTLGRDRALSMYYNSATALPLILVAANVTESATRQTPNVVKAWLTVHGVLKDSAQFYPIQSGTTAQIVLGRNLGPSAILDTLTSGRYAMTLVVRNDYGSSIHDVTINDSVLIVNQAKSGFGRGWSLLGLEQIYSIPGDTTRRVWVAGDGSVRLYAKATAGSSVFVGAVGDRPDSLIRFDTLSAKWYRRNLPHGASVIFDETGKHRATRNRVNAETRFTWTTVANKARLDSIIVPPNDTGHRAYKFYWNTSSGVLDSIRDPGGRRLKSVISGGTLVSLTDPDNQVTRFTYAANLLTRRAYPRKGMKGDSASTIYAYSHNARLTSVAIQTDSAGASFATTVLTPWDEYGLATGWGAQYAAVNTSGFATRVDGPLSGTADATDIRVDRFGAPTLMTNIGLGTVTNIWHDSTSLPGLVTKVQYPHAGTPGAGGRIVRLSWNARGNLTQTRDSTYFLDSRPTKTSTYTYGSGTAPDSPTLIQDAIGRATTFTYNSLGLTDSIRDPRGHWTKYAYVTSGPLTGQLSSITERQIQTWVQGSPSDSTLDQVQSFSYDINGNLLTGTSPAGVITSYVADNVGRITDVYDPLGTRTSYSYDIMNRIVATIAYTSAQSHPTIPSPLAGCSSLHFLCADVTAPFAPSLPATLTTSYAYTPSGTLDSILDPRGVKRRTIYDARLNVSKERNEFGLDKRYFYNLAGLLDSVTTRSGFTIRYRYDTVGRRTAMIYPIRPPAPSTHPDTIPGDSVSYTYDLLGNLLVSKGNTAGTINTRTYWADNTVQSFKMSRPGYTDSLYYEYDATGARTLMVAADQDSSYYIYNDSTGNLDTIRVSVDSSGAGTTRAIRRFAFTYDALGRRRQITYPHSITVQYYYDVLGVLRKVVGTNPYVPIGTDRFDFTFESDTVDPIGHILHQKTQCLSYSVSDPSMAPCGGSGTRNLHSRYNRLGALVFQLDNTQRDSIHYDASGNIIYRYRSSGGFPGRDSMIMVAGSNRLAADTNMTTHSRVEYRYDADGSRYLELVSPLTEGNDLLWRFHYYNSLGLRTGFAYTSWGVDTVDYHYHPTLCKFDPDGRVNYPCDIYGSNMSSDGANVSSMLGWRFFSGGGPDDFLMGRFALGSTRRTLYFITDGQGRQLAVGDSIGAILNGDLNTIDQASWKFAGAIQDGFGFNASRQESNVLPGVSYFRNRAYDQRTGRWLQEDPIGLAGGINLYQFSGNNPVAYTDPFGLSPNGPCKPKTPIGAVICIVVNLVSAQPKLPGLPFQDMHQATTPSPTVDPVEEEMRREMRRQIAPPRTSPGTPTGTGSPSEPIRGTPGGVPRILAALGYLAAAIGLEAVVGPALQELPAHDSETCRVEHC